ncbi:hypothetical protein PVL29_014346 [Vitis rotundifolia]|uniref:Peroxidase n=1 Tax=Vitis rotundifolia TaxID=103349 RepID=A0AA39DNN5_VITRO|nr:hypothetical protein PVL29_014346 [Vitis rotundifolia]
MVQMEPKWLVLLVVILGLSWFAETQQGLIHGFYSSSCPKAEAIVSSTVVTHFKKDPTIAAGVLKLHFKDCFFQGCDGSVGDIDALPDAELRGFGVIDDAKTKLETLCPGVVSCADILALAARDAVGLSGGPIWPVPTGRRDGRLLFVSPDLPAPTDSIPVLREKFAAKGLNNHDLVTLVGAHTIGQTDCSSFQYRLYNFTAKGNADPTINQAFLAQLRALCPDVGGNVSKSGVPLDKGSQFKFDVSFFKNLRDGNGVLESDQRLFGDSETQRIVKNYAGNGRGLLGLRFAFEFPKAMIKMSSIGVKTGTQGEIRKTCSRFNQSIESNEIEY